MSETSGTNLEPLTEKIPLLDHGYIQIIEKWGSDERIIEAARMSTDKGFKGWGDADMPGDERLLKFLYTHNHATPFEMAGLVIEVQAPLMVFREWQRHRTQSYNELSARYTEIPELNYTPEIGRIMRKNGANKQANAAPGAKELTEDAAQVWIDALANFYKQSQTMYQIGLNLGVPKELARICIPVGRYSRMRASANLRNWLAFLTLRSTMKGPNAQEEIRVYADTLGEYGIKTYFPRTWELFCNG